MKTLSIADGAIETPRHQTTVARSKSLESGNAAQDGPLQRKAGNRAKIVSLASRGRLPAVLEDRVNIEDCVLLSDCTQNAKSYGLASAELSASIIAAILADIDRVEIYDALMAGGLAFQTAKNLVSKASGPAVEIAHSKGDKLAIEATTRKSKGKRELPPEAERAAQVWIDRCNGDAYHALKLAKLAIKGIEAQIATLERAKAKAKPAAPVVVASVQVAA